MHNSALQGERDLKEIGVGVIGVGFMGSKHARLIAETQGVRLLGIADTDGSQAKAVAETNHAEHFFTDYNKLLALDKLDAVIVATPEHLHHEPVIASLNAGKYVLVEKPIATTLKDADAMIAAAEKSNGRLMVGYVFRFDSKFAALKDYVDQGALGQPMSAYGKMNSPIQSGRYWGKQVPLELSFSVHFVDLILWYFQDEPVEVFSERIPGRLTKEIGIADFDWMFFRLSKGGLGVIQCGWALSQKWGGEKSDGTYSKPSSWYRAPDMSFEIVGTNGSAYLDYHPQSLEACDDEGWKFPETATWPIIHGRIGGALREEVSHFLDCVRNGKEPLVDGKFARKSLETVLASMRSAEENQKVKIRA